MIEWLYELLGRMLGKGDGRRRDILSHKRCDALSVFDKTKQKLTIVKDNLDVERQRCETRIAKKRWEVCDEEKASHEMAMEQKRIDVTVDSINKILGVEEVDEYKAEGDIN